MIVEVDWLGNIRIDKKVYSPDMSAHTLIDLALKDSNKSWPLPGTHRAMVFTFSKNVTAPDDFKKEDETHDNTPGT